MGRPMSQPGGGTARSKSKEDRHSYRHLQPTTWPTIQHVVIPGRTLMKASNSKLANLSGYIGKIDSFDQRFRNRMGFGRYVLSRNINKNEQVHTKIILMCIEMQGNNLDKFLLSCNCFFYSVWLIMFLVLNCN